MLCFFQYAVKLRKPKYMPLGHIRDMCVRSIFQVPEWYIRANKVIINHPPLLAQRNLWHLFNYDERTTELKIHFWGSKPKASVLIGVCCQLHHHNSVALYPIYVTKSIWFSINVWKTHSMDPRWFPIVKKLCCLHLLMMWQLLL